MDLPERLKSARTHLEKEQKEMAALLSISFRSWQDYELGKSAPGGKVFEALVRTGFNANWLLTGEGPMMKEEPASEEYKTLAEFCAAQIGKQQETVSKPVVNKYRDEGFVQVPRFEIAASAGGGAVVHSEQIVDYMAFRAEWLKTSMGMSPGNAAVISVVGDSMEPYLADGDLILIDMGVKRIENDSVYVLQAGDSLLVKRVQRKFDGTVIVKSDNESYEPEVFRGDSVEYLKVIGRMVRRLVR